MKLLNTYEDRGDAEKAFQNVTGEKRLASERDSTVVGAFPFTCWSMNYN